MPMALDDINHELFSVFERATKSGLNKEDVYEILQTQFRNAKPKRGKSRLLFILLAGVFLLMAVRLSYFGKNSMLELLFDTLKESPCLLEQNPVSMEMTRPLANCSMCQELESVPRIDNISKKEFIEIYAYSGRPIVVTDAISNWSALELFNFSYFKKLYEETKESYQINEDCQFFPYRTDFKSLKDAFNMTVNRSLLQEDSWYFGW